jgi:ferrochelatase
MKTGVLFVNFGGPTRDEELEPFLYNLLSDVLPGPEPFARFLAGRIAPRRAAVVRPIYRRIGWSPLVADSRAQAEGAMAGLNRPDLPWAVGMMFSEPSIEASLRELLAAGVERVLVVGLFPHYSFATAASAYDFVHKALVRLDRVDLPVHYTKVFFDEPDYLEALASTIRRGVANLDGDGPLDLLFSAHGIPLSFIRRGDPYPDHVRESVRRVVRLLDWQDPWHLAWQSRLGPAKWLAPSTPDAIERLARGGARRLLIVPVSFVGEHIETLDEIDREYREHALHAGFAHVGRAPALGLEPAFLRCLSGLVRGALERFEVYSCARCLRPEDEGHRRQVQCGNCRFVFPRYLREGAVGG